MGKYKYSNFANVSKSLAAVWKCRTPFHFLKLG